MENATISREPDNGSISESDAVARGGEAMLLDCRFNQDGGCFVLATGRGFRIFNCNPFKETFRREDTKQTGSLAKVEMLFRCNILALIGGGPSPKFPSNRVMIWDDHQERCIGELSFRSDVRNVKLRRDRIVVVLDAKCYVYNFENLKPIHQIETIADNKDGVCAISSDSDSIVLACPGLQRGQVRLEIYNLRRTRFITAHEGSISCMELNTTGSILATASEKGTLIRIFDTMEGTLLHELRRGADRAKIHCLTFSNEVCVGSDVNRFDDSGGSDRSENNNSNNNKTDLNDFGGSAYPAWIASTSDKGTVHVWSLAYSDEMVEKDERGRSRTNSATSSPVSPDMSKGNPTSAFSFFKGVLPRYFSSVWSFAHYRLPDASHSCVAFGDYRRRSSDSRDSNEGNYRKIYVVTGSGGFHELKFDAHKPGECVQVVYTKTNK